MSKNLLLLSSSKFADSGYLTHALPFIQTFLSKVEPIKPDGPLIFIPFAGVSVEYDDYEKMVQTAFAEIGSEIKSIHHFKDKQSAIKNASGIVVGGGNTFALLDALYQNELIGPIQQLINNGTPYIGWSAGSNIAAPSIKTTNDMPIVEPASFDAFGFLPFQINPHYIEGNPPGHNGETRQQRLEEFLIKNPSSKIVAIPEGSAIQLQNQHLQFIGPKSGFLFSLKQKLSINSTSDLQGLLN